MKRSIIIISIFLMNLNFGYSQILPSGTSIVNHISKLDSVYPSSPAICVLANGNYIVSHDLFGPASNSAIFATTYVFKSTDKGVTWSKISTISGLCWANIFNFNNKLYMMGVDKGLGNIVIRCSTDNGVSWTSASDSKTGLLFRGGYHTAPTPVVIYNGRIWRAFEYANTILTSDMMRYGPMMISADVNSDLMNAKSWTKTNVLSYDPNYLQAQFRGWFEGNAVVTKENELVDVLRVHIWPGIDEHVAIVKVNCKGDAISFQPQSGFVKFPGGAKKFTIRYDETSQRYWTLSNFVPAANSADYPASVRNYLTLMSSVDLRTWQVHKLILSHPDRIYHGFQYIDFLFDTNDIIFVSRTAYDDYTGGAQSYQEANYLTFQRIKYFLYLKKNIY